jgi:hypothetical protein
VLRRPEVERRVGHHPLVDRGKGFRHLRWRLKHVPEQRQPAAGPQHLHRLGRAGDRVDPVAPMLIGTGHLLFAGREGTPPEAEAVHKVVTTVIAGVVQGPQR